MQMSLRINWNENEKINHMLLLVACFGNEFFFAWFCRVALLKNVKIIRITLFIDNNWRIGIEQQRLMSFRAEMYNRHTINKFSHVTNVCGFSQRNEFYLQEDSKWKRRISSIVFFVVVRCSRSYALALNRLPYTRNFFSVSAFLRAQFSFHSDGVAHN